MNYHTETSAYNERFKCNNVLCLCVNVKHEPQQQIVKYERIMSMRESSETEFCCTLSNSVFLFQNFIYKTIL